MTDTSLAGRNGGSGTLGPTPCPTIKVIKLQSAEGTQFPIDDDIISMCTTVRHMLKKGGRHTFSNALGGQFCVEGSYAILKKEGRVLASLVSDTNDETVIALNEVKSSVLEKVLDYCRFHVRDSHLSEKEKKLWDAEFVNVKTNVLCELASASYNLDIKPLVLLTSRAIATHVSGKPTEELRETFNHINCDACSPVLATSLATRCRLQRKHSQKQHDSKDKPTAVADDRDLDELLSFINEDKRTTKGKGNNNHTTASALASAEGAALSKRRKKKDKKKLAKSADAIVTLERAAACDTIEQNSPTPPSTEQLISPRTQSTKRPTKAKRRRKKTLSIDSSPANDPTTEQANEKEEEPEPPKAPEVQKGRLALTSSAPSFWHLGNGSEERIAEEDGSFDSDEEPLVAELVEDGDEEEEEELDPTKIAEIDREVEAFRRRLESVNQQQAPLPKIRLPMPAKSFLSLVGAC